MSTKRLTRRVAEYIQDALYEMGEDELVATIRDAKRLNKTNCWWLEHKVRHAVIEAAQNHFELRRGGRPPSGEGSAG